ncbi:MAG: RNA polymerase-binding protein DksA [Bradymonadaceae bacterium]
MDSSKLEEFREQLEERRQELLEKILDTLDDVELSQNERADEVDLAKELAEQNFNLRLRGRERRLIDKINHAIQRIEANEFGDCVSCGEQIALKRLRARPVTTMCIDCKEEEERREQRYSD